MTAEIDQEDGLGPGLVACDRVLSSLDEIRKLDRDLRILIAM